MKVYDAASIRNIALVGHSGSGKTQLASAILSDAGMVNRFGQVDEGTTVTDFDEEEIARKHTLSASLAYAEWNKQKINLIDAPGIGDTLRDAPPPGPPPAGAEEKKKKKSGPPPRARSIFGGGPRPSKMFPDARGVDQIDL